MRMWAVWPVLLTLAVGCGSGGAPRTVDHEALQATMSRYVTALAAGDADGAARERCTGARIATGDRELFTAQAKELIAMAGITGARVVLPPRIRIAAADGSSDPTSFDFVVVGHTGESAPLHGAAVVEQGAVRLCGYAQPDVDRFSSEIAAPADVGRRRAGELRALLPESPLAGLARVEDQVNPPRPDTPPGRLESWTRAWQRPDFGGARATISRYENADRAAAAVGTTWRSFAGDITERFEVPGRPAAVGFRYSAVAWSWMQPPAAGYQIDLVLMLAGDTVITVAVAGLPPTAGHDDVLALTAAVADSALA